MFGFDKSFSGKSEQSSKDPKSKEYFKTNSISGLFRSFDPKTGKIKQEGKFQNGKEVGLWKEFDEDGDQIHYQFTMQRVGALCMDGSTSSATGRGACSRHGGVAEWLYDSFKRKVGGTGKYLPIERRIDSLKQEVKATFKINKTGQQLQQQILKLVLFLNKKTIQLETQLQKASNKIEESRKQVSSANQKVQNLTVELKDMKKKERFEVIKAKEELKQKQRLKNTKQIIYTDQSHQEKPKKSTGGQKMEEKSQIEQHLRRVDFYDLWQEKSKQKKGGQKVEVKKQEPKPKIDDKSLDMQNEDKQKIWNKKFVEQFQPNQKEKDKSNYHKTNENAASQIGSNSEQEDQQQDLSSINKEDQSGDDSRLIRQLMNRLKLT